MKKNLSEKKHISQRETSASECMTNSSNSSLNLTNSPREI